MTQQTFMCCPECHSRRIQSQMWVRQDTGEVLDDTERYQWCEACGEDGKDGEVAYGSLVELTAEQTREGCAPEPDPQSELNLTEQRNVLLKTCVAVLGSLERNLTDEFLPETKAALREAIEKAGGAL